MDQPPQGGRRSVADCLTSLGVTAEALRGCTTLREEWQVIKKTYFAKVLRDHPDKGGSAQAFRESHAAWEVLRSIKAQQQDDDDDNANADAFGSFADHLHDGVTDQYDTFMDAFATDPSQMPSYEFFHEAAAQEVPGYRIERAKSGRGSCHVCKKRPSRARQQSRQAAAQADAAKPPPQEEEAPKKTAAARQKKARGQAAAAAAIVKTKDADADEEEKKPAATRKQPSRKTKGRVIVKKEEVNHDDEAAEEEAEEDLKMPPLKKAKTEATGSTTSTTIATVPETTMEVAAGPPALIPKGALRAGRLEHQTGTYTNWTHLDCWRVPYRVWAYFTDLADADLVLAQLLELDQVLLTGITVLDEAEQAFVVAHVMDKSHWARKTKASKPPPCRAVLLADVALKEAVEQVAAANTTSMAVATAVPSSSDVGLPSERGMVLHGKQHFVIPRPGVDGAVPDSLQGITFVCTGVFPEVGGGLGLSLGKDRVKAMIESFGGVVRSAVSGKTAYLVVGKEPGTSKVGEAQRRQIPMLDLMQLQKFLLGKVETLENAPLPVIRSFSAGFTGRRIMDG